MASNSPMFSYTLLYLSGIAMGNNLLTNPKSLFIVATIMVALLTLLLLTNKKRNNYLLNYSLRTSIFVTLFILGALNISISPYSKKELYSRIPVDGNPKRVLLEVVETMNIGPKTANIVVYSKVYNELLILYSYDLSLFESFKRGNIVDISIKPRRIEASKGFEWYYHYRLSQRCFNYAFVSKKEILSSSGKSNHLKYKIGNIRDSIISKIREKNRDEEWVNIFIAIVSGEKSYLEEETKARFKSAGALHLMAVSGLHTGFVYMIVMSILFFLGGKRVMKLIKAMVVTLFIWSYVAFSGFSTSSIRAAIMITIMLASWFVSGRYISLNALSTSALIITLMNPASIYSVGFQLSFVAMLSILFINPFFSSIQVKNRILRYFKDILTISFSCQLGTSIITIATFGEFPLYFLISNVVLMPLTAVTMSIASLIPILGFSSTLLSTLLKPIKLCVNLMNSFATRIETLPLATISIEKGSLFHISFTSIVILIILWLVNISPRESVALLSKG